MAIMVMVSHSGDRLSTSRPLEANRSTDSDFPHLRYVWVRVGLLCGAWSWWEGDLWEGRSEGRAWVGHGPSHG